MPPKLWRFTTKVFALELPPFNVEDIQAWFNDPKHPLLFAVLEDSWSAGFMPRVIAVRPGTRALSSIACMLPARFMGKAIRIWKLVSRIFPENTASLALCAKTGFREVGMYEKHSKLDGVA